MSFLQSIIKELDNEFASVVEDGVAAGDCESFVDTGSYILNALISGSIFGGLPANKITALAGESSTGKTFFALSICKHFLNSNPDAQVIYFETELSKNNSEIYCYILSYSFEFWLQRVLFKFSSTCSKIRRVPRLRCII